MKLTPTEILQHLGFDISNDGIEINENDAYLITSALHLVGKSINTDQIPDAELATLHCGTAGLVFGCSESGLISPIGDTIKEMPSGESLMKLRATLDLLLRVTFKHHIQKDW
ncbi:hypothetical protein [Hahella ganghwensis]|uniref:hypothetical protein n=1 Tax=Hahella ganghwensis TaxID=286420 RepID=UPI0003686A35|nr:hypothetical protein [Hahella ganghwensis]